MSNSSRTNNKRKRSSRRSRKGRGSKRASLKHMHRESDKDTRRSIPDVKDNIRIVTLSGFEQVGKNMIAVEIGDDIIIIDCGYSFKDEEMPGIDYVLPNTKYLEDRKDKIRGVVITHGHLDHIGGIPYIFPRLDYPPIYCRSFTDLMIRKRQEEFPGQPDLDINVVETSDTVQLGNLTVRFYGITHTIPDSMGVIIETPHGIIVNQADFKLDHKDGKVSKEEREVYEAVGKEDVLLLMADSTNVENAGFSTPEWQVHRDLEKIIRRTEHRLIIGTFASQIDRLIKIIEFAEKYDRKVVLEGRSMRTNLAVAKQAGLLKPKKETLISAQESQNLKDNKVLILATGSQGEEFAALNRMANKSHRHLTFKPTDTVVLSSSIIPGNEIAIAKLKDNIARTGAHLITYRTSDLYVHGSGHGNRAELAWLHNTLKEKFFIPQHGHHFMLRLHADLAEEIGINPDHIVIPENGAIIEIQEDGKRIKKLKEHAPSDTLTVDGFNIGSVQDVVIRDRNMLAEEGIFIVIVTIDPRSGKLRKSPDLISRGFVYLRESKELLEDTRDEIRTIVKRLARGKGSVNFDNLKSEVTDHVRKILLQRTGKRPLVIPVVIGV